MQPITVASNGIEIAYETFGAPGDRPLLLVMGLGGQMKRPGFDAHLVLCVRRPVGRRGSSVVTWAVPRWQRLPWQGRSWSLLAQRALKYLAMGITV